MTALKEAIAVVRARAAAGFPRSPTTQCETQRQLQTLDQQVGTAEAVEDLRPFLRRAANAGVGSLRRHEMNRVLRGAWCDRAYDELGLAAVAQAELDARRSSDQAMIEGYLTWFPHDRECIEHLSDAARAAAGRHEWAWRKRSLSWRLFEPLTGPARVGRAVAGAPPGEASTLLTGMGLGRQIASTGIGRHAFIVACTEIAKLRGEKAVVSQEGLLHLFDSDVQASDLPHLVRALLEPWIAEKPETAHRKKLSEFLIDQIGDPRTAAGRWKHIRESLVTSVGAERGEAIVHVLKRWLTEVAMREFFRAIAKTTDRPDQWDQRAKFWLAYLDADLVSDAWPALGVRARYDIERIIRQSGERPEYGVLTGGPSSSSTLIMQIGDLRIAEWSDNGSCRFWNSQDPAAPGLYWKKYDGGKLRTTYGRQDYEFHPHVPASPAWEGIFAGVVHRRTGVMHPIFGRGYGRNRNWNDL